MKVELSKYECKVIREEGDPKVEECSKHNGENCPNWHEKMKISINGRPYRRY